MLTARAGRSVAFAPDDAAVGFDLDFEDFAILGAGEGGEGLAAANTGLLVVGPVADLFDGGQSGVVAAWVSGSSALLATRFLGCGVGGWCGFADGGADFGFVAEELLFAET
jgi:hypothetical protein